MKNPRTIPCRMCQAAPGDLCKYKGVPHTSGTALGGHEDRTPRRYRCYCYKRVADVRCMQDLGAW